MSKDSIRGSQSDVRLYSEVDLQKAFEAGRLYEADELLLDTMEGAQEIDSSFGNSGGKLSVESVKESIVMTGSIPAYHVCPFLGDCNGCGVRCPIDWSVLPDKPVSCGMARMFVL